MSNTLYWLNITPQTPMKREFQQTFFLTAESVNCIDFTTFIDYNDQIGMHNNLFWFNVTPKTPMKREFSLSFLFKLQKVESEQ